MLKRYIHWLPLGMGLATLLGGGGLVVAAGEAFWPAATTSPPPAAAHAPYMTSARWRAVEQGLFGLVLLSFAPNALARAYRARYAPSFSAWMTAGSPEAPVFAVEASQLRLLRPYPFRASQLAGRTTVAAAELTEISPAGSYAVLANREKLFFDAAQWPAVVALAQRYGIAQVSRLPIWALLTASLGPEPAAAAAHTSLAATDIGPAEVRRVQHTLRRWWCASFRWLGEESLTCYDHYQVLYVTGTALFRRQRWYWHTMELALRGPAQPAHFRPS